MSDISKLQSHYFFPKYVKYLSLRNLGLFFYNGEDHISPSSVSLDIIAIMASTFAAAKSSAALAASSLLPILTEELRLREALSDRLVLDVDGDTRLARAALFARCSVGDDDNLVSLSVEILLMTSFTFEAA